jgi:hypothetical protein
MKKVLCLLLLFAAPLAASAQTPPRVADTPPPGLSLDAPKWEDIFVQTGMLFGDFTYTGRGPSPHPTINYNRPAHVARHVPEAGLSWSPNSDGPRYVGQFRAASVSLTNTNARTVKAVRLEFVFTDPSNGAEVLRLRHRTTKRLGPGVTKLIRKEFRAHRRARRGDGARLCVEVTEIVYADGTSWRRPEPRQAKLAAAPPGLTLSPARW